MIPLLILMFVSSVYGQGTLVNFNTIPKSGTALMLTHMDDDVIWMLPWWKISEKFLSGAMPWDPVYQTIVDQQQAYLDANGYDIQYKANWIMPWGNITHQQYSDYYWDNLSSSQYLALDHLIAYWDDNDLTLVRTEVNRIKAKIEQYIASPSISRIVTHNNWGEYGHQQHKAVNKAVRELAVKYRKDVWMLGCNNGDFIDVDVPDGITYTMASFNDPTLYWAIKTIYENNWCWTWYDNIPSGDHKFIKIVDGGVDKSTLLTGETVAVSGPVQANPGAYIFDGTDDFMTLVGNSTSSFTVAMNVRPDVIRNMDISKMTEYPGNATSDRNFYLNSNGTVSARIYDGSDKIVTSTTALQTNTWTHVAMVGNGSSLTLYVNGIAEGTITAGSAITSYSSPEFVMGQTGVTSSFFNGQISDVQLLDHALSASEVAALSGVKYTITASAGTGGSISPSGSVSAIAGSNSTFTISPVSTYSIADVRVDNVSVGAVITYTFTGVKANHTIAATFTPRSTHTITVTQGDHGTISPSGSVLVGEGTDQTFTITGNIGYQVSDVLADGVSAGAVSSYTFTNVISDHSITATFVPCPTFTISATAGSGGSISPSGSIVVNQGSNQTFTFTPNTGYRISGVTVDGNPVGAVTSYTLNNITANHSISVAFVAIPTYTITASAGSGGSISPSGNVSVTEGAGTIFTITANSGYAISSVLVDNVSVGAVSSYTFSNVTANHTISATFSLITYSISASAGSGGTIAPSGLVTVNYGSSRTFTITPAAGYAISTVTVDDVSQGSITSYTFSDIRVNHIIAATFTPITYTITSSVSAGGTITPSGSRSVTYGANQTYSITPNTGYYISDVVVDNASVGAVASYTFNNVTANHTVSATFAIYTYSLTSTAGAGGSISPSGSLTANYGTSQTYTITPNNGYNISDVQVDNVSVGPVASYTFTNISATHTISASFGLHTYTLTVTPGTGGSILPSGPVSVTYGGNQTFSISPSTGYRISDVIVDNTSIGAVSSYSFTNVSANHNISATFVLLTYSLTATAGSGGAVSPSGTVVNNYGSNRTFTFTPSAGYQVEDVIVDGNSVGAVSEYTFSGIAGNHTVSASFSLLQYIVSGSAGTGGSISPAGDVSASYGSNQTFTITPDTGYNIQDVKVDNVSVGAVESYTFSNIVTAHTITATFAIKQFTITVVSGENGSIQPGEQITADYGSSKTFDIVPAEGFSIAVVTVDNLPVGRDPIYTFSDIVSDHTISATFDHIILYTITANAGKGGIISPAGSLSLPENSNQTYLINPEKGYRIFRVVVDNSDLGALNEYTFSMIGSDHSISAEFSTETDVSVYPTPFTEEFKVKIASPLSGKFDIYVYDEASRIVNTQSAVDPVSTTTIRLKSISKGVYFVRIFYHDAVVSTLKIIKM
jgi:hypothetical protein